MKKQGYGVSGYFLMNRILVLIFLLAGHQLSAAQTPTPQPIPADDRDIEAVITKTGYIKDFARVCAGTECDMYDCAEAEKMYENARDARFYLEQLYLWQKRHHADAAAHHESLQNSVIISAERSAKVQNILAYQEYFVGIASTMLDITSIMTNLKDVFSSEKALSEMSRGEAIERLDTLYESLKSVENAKNTIEKSGTSAPGGKIVGFDDDELNDIKSSMSDIRSLISETQKNSGDWRKAVKSAKGRASIGALAGRLATAFARDSINERKRLLEKLSNEISEGERLVARAYLDRARSLTRRDKAKDAFDALDDLVVVTRAAGSGQLSRCMLKGQRRCRFFPNYISMIRVPDLLNASVTTPRQITRKSLLYYKDKLPGVAESLSFVPENKGSVEPRMSIARMKFEPGDPVNVSYRTSSCLPSNAWIGINKSTLEHGSETRNKDALVGSAQMIGATREGTMSFNAPTEPGSYDLRMNDPFSEEEIAFLKFTVEERDTPPATVILGDWQTSYGIMTFKQTGSRITGEYTADNNEIGRIVGEMRGNVLEGFWLERDSQQTCDSVKHGSENWGRIEFRFEGDHFSGNWNYCGRGDLKNESWDGDRIKK